MLVVIVVTVVTRTRRKTHLPNSVTGMPRQSKQKKGKVSREEKRPSLFMLGSHSYDKKLGSRPTLGVADKENAKDAENWRNDEDTLGLG